MNGFGFQIITKDFDVARYKIYIDNLSRIAVKSCADVLQLRNKKSTAKDIYYAALYIKSLLSKFSSGRKPLFIVNDRPDIAYLTGADGVHIGQDDFPLITTKKIYPDLIVGVSACNLKEALVAQNEGADYIGVGPVYDTSSKADAGNMISPENIKTICRSVKIPVIAIGGINTYNIKELSTYGVKGVAVINAISGSVNPLKTAVTFRQNIDKLMGANAARV
ncbi:MAG: thiamine phosphate synthase [Deltaproteobacteria bacterium]|nr:thiamine phosphate synthase [Deltaproteobacteria bacterium]